MQRLRRHVRSNVIGYLALFVALSGSAYAVTAPKNSVKSKSIKNGQVRSIDLQDGGIGAADLGPGSVQSGGIQDGGVQSVDLADGAVQAGDLAPGVVGESAFGRVSANGNFSRSQGIVDVEHTGGSTLYCFDLAVAPQIGVATIDAAPGPAAGANVTVQIPGGPAGLGCGPPFDDAAAATYQDGIGGVSDEASFFIHFD